MIFEKAIFFKYYLGSIFFVAKQAIRLILDFFSNKPRYVLSGRARELVTCIVDSLLSIATSHAMERKKKTLAGRNIRKILIIRIDRLGDLVCTSPVITNLRDAFPKADIWAVVSPVGISLLEYDSRLDKILQYHTWRYAPMRGAYKSIQERNGIVKLLYKQNFDLILHLRSTSGLLLFGLLSKAVNASPGTHSTELHGVESSLSCLRKLGIAVNKKELSIFTGEKDCLFAQETLSNGMISSEDFVIGIHTGAGNESRRWDARNFGRVVKELDERSDRNIRFIIFGGPNDIARANVVITASGNTNIISVAGKTTVSQMAALLRKCNLFIGQDTGPTHMASAFKVPVVVIWGNEPFERAHPWTDSGFYTIAAHPMDCQPCMYFECKKGFECIRSISPEQVINAALEQMKRSKKGNRDSACFSMKC